MMNAVSLTDSMNVHEKVDLINLIAELDREKKRSEWLSKMNNLHARLAESIDLTSMIEAFSVWLMPFVEHDLIGFHHPSRNRQHLFCSCHGPDRRRVIKAAESIFLQATAENEREIWVQDQYYAMTLKINAMKDSGMLLLIRKENKISTNESCMIQDALEVLNEPLQRALDYEDLFDLARLDTLTGLANRRVFEERIPPLLDAAHRHGHKLTLCSMDLDKFKQINDGLGHAEGDRVLQCVAETFSAMVRSSDILVRMGGDEFFLVLVDTDLASAHVLAERLRRGVDDLDIYASPEVKLGVSIGLVEWHSGLSMDEWILKADELLYYAKNTGRCKVCA